MESVLRNKKYILLFIMPALLLYSIIVLFPVIKSVFMSVFKWDLSGAQGFIGLKNYYLLFTQDEIFQTSLRNNIWLMIMALIFHMPGGILVAAVLSGNLRGSKFFRSVYFMPSVLCSAGVGFLWTYIFNSQFGIINNILNFWGLSGLTKEWLSDEKTVMWALIAVVVWQWLGYHMVFYLAAMMSIPNSLYEAARIDGASSARTFWSVTLPLIKPIIKIDGILITTGTLRYFDLVYVMTNGGPNHASEVMASHMYMQAFRLMKFGYGSAIAVIMLILCLLMTGLFNYIFKSERLEY